MTAMMVLTMAAGCATTQNDRPSEFGSAEEEPVNNLATTPY